MPIVYIRIFNDRASINSQGRSTVQLDKRTYFVSKYLDFPFPAILSE